MDIQPTATGRSRDPDHGKAHQSNAEVGSGLGSDQRDMWRMGKVQELRVRSWWMDEILKARLTTNSDTLVLGQRLVFPAC